MFRRLLVANRGEIALRVLRAAREMGIRSVAVYSEADRESPHVAAADEAVCIGPARAAESYLDMDALLAAAEMTDCQALHPGYGFLAENAVFAARCRQQGLAFIGPGAGAIRLMGDKAAARRAARRAGLPTIPGSEGVVAGAEEAREVARRVGWPVLLKAAAGGGGRGMRVVRRPEELAARYAEASLEAEKAFGQGGLYVEKLLEDARHIEFQLLADAYGHAVHLGERECSIQRSHQKLLEESPSPAVSDSVRARLGEQAARAAAAVGYVSAGTMEFLMEPGGELYFMEMNTRLQVEHPVTEMVTGVDLVQQQIAVAANVPLALRQEAIALRGHAIEVRVNAEDPEKGFRPESGLVTALEIPPCGESLRFDTCLAAGGRVPPWYDSMVGKLIAHGADREEARARLAAALAALRIEGIRTTVGLHREILEDPEFRAGRTDTGFLPRFLERRGARAGAQ